MTLASVQAPAGADPAFVAPAPARAAALVAGCLPLRYDTDIDSLLTGLSGAPFQSHAMFPVWLATYAGRGTARECFLLTLKDARGTLVFALPVVRRKVGGLRLIELPHSGVIDFTLPLTRPGVVPLPEPEALWALLRPALPSADLVVLRRLDPGGPGAGNPLYALPATQPSQLVTWRLEALQEHGARHAALAKPFRKKLRRNREKLLATEGMRIVVAHDSEQALPLLAAIEQMQGARIRGKGLDYGLDCARARDFYRRFVTRGVASGNCLMVGLMMGERVICAGLALVEREFAVYLRVASDFGEFAALTPGLVVTDIMMDEAHARGVRIFDFGMGSYRFKRQMGGSPLLLRDLVMPLTPRGWPVAVLMRLLQRARSHPLLRRLTGRDPLPYAAR